MLLVGEGPPAVLKLFVGTSRDVCPWSLVQGGISPPSKRQGKAGTATSAEPEPG